MFEKTDTPWAPWFVGKSNDKKQVRLNIITHLLSKIPYEEIKRGKIELPKRQAAGTVSYTHLTLPTSDLV